MWSEYFHPLFTPLMLVILRVVDSFVSTRLLPFSHFLLSELKYPLLALQAGIQASALLLLANSLFYNHSNRRRLVAMPKTIWKLLMLCRHESDDVAQVLKQTRAI